VGKVGRRTEQAGIGADFLGTVSLVDAELLKLEVVVGQLITAIVHFGKNEAYLVFETSLLIPVPIAKIIILATQSLYPFSKEVILE
jgi:hypothetical protein